MTDALINDKPQFVRLFTENGLNILDYLTYGRLESLYRSVVDGTLLYQLLQRHLVLRLGSTASAPTSSNAQDSPSKLTAENIQSGSVMEISLFEVTFSVCKGLQPDSQSGMMNIVKKIPIVVLFAIVTVSLGVRGPGTVTG